MGNLNCGGPLTEPCIADNDIRYDADASDNLKDQSVLWGKLEGLWVGSSYQYGEDYEPQRLSDFGPMNTFPWPQFDNITVKGTRFYHHGYGIFGSDNANLSGWVILSEVIGHSTYERDGSIKLFPASSGLNYNGLSSVPDADSAPATFSYPVGVSSAMTPFSSVIRTGQEQDWVSTRTCLDDECSKMYHSYDAFLDGKRTVSYVGIQTKVTEEEWVSQLNQAYEDANLKEDDRHPVPMETECLLAPKCRTENDFCNISGDPSCSESPYQEPDGKVKTGAIAGFTVAGFFLLIGIMSLIFWHLLKKQAKRNRAIFAARVAETMSIKKSMRSLSPEELEKEFNKIDQEHGGRITKEDLWIFLNSGKAGEINKRDFEALWAVMDVDKSGSVDFLEFCAYMGKCHEEYNAAVRMDRSSTVAASVARLSVAKSVSAKFVDGLVEVEDIDEEEEKNQDSEE